MKKFFRKVWLFLKRNTYAIAVCVCVVLVITMVTLTALTFVNHGEEETPVLPDIPSSEEQNVPTIPTDTDKVIEFAFPVINGVISKGYAEDFLLEDKTSGDYITHQGVDFQAAAGAKVVAVFDGVVEKVEPSMMDGMVVTIRHSNDLVSVYRSLADEVFVKAGDTVVKGQEIGSVSSNITEKGDGIHLHYELYEADKLVDPTAYFESAK